MQPARALVLHGVEIRLGLFDPAFHAVLSVALHGAENIGERIGAAMRAESVAGRTLELHEAMLGGGGGKLLVWQWYWIDGATTSRGYRGKLLQVRQKLLHRRDDGAALMLSARYDDNPDEARRVLRAFLDANLAALESTLGSALAGGRRP